MGKRGELYNHNLRLVGYEFVVPLPYHHLSVIAVLLRPRSSKNAKILMQICSYFVRLSVKAKFIVPKIAFIKHFS